jgi:hypothetical protein
MTRGRLTLKLATLMVFCSSLALAAGTAPPDANKRSGPPPEAYKACEGKAAGDTSQFVGPHGNTVTGTCVQREDKLVLRPDHPKGQGGPGQHTPPPGAFTACEGKKAGEAAKFVNPKGMTIAGTCVQMGDRLALRPDRPKGAPPTQ